MQSFILPANGQATPKSIERKRKMAEAMLAQGVDYSPIASPWQGAARMANALVGGLGQRKADKQEAEGMASAREAMIKALNGGDNAAVIDAVSNPFMDNNSMGLLSHRYGQLNKEPDPMARLITGEEATSMGLPPGAYNLFPDGKISQIGGNGTNVNINNADPNQPMMGTIPSGWAAVRDPSAPSGFRMVQIDGGPAALETDAAAAKAELAQDTKELSADIVTQDIDRAIAAIDEPGWLPKTGLGAETLKEYGGTGAADLAEILSTVEANTAFDALAAMRAASPTGGALGAITPPELKLLAATKGALTQKQSSGQLKDNLNRLWNVTQDIIHGPNAGPPRRKLKFQEQGADDDGYIVEEVQP